MRNRIKVYETDFPNLRKGHKFSLKSQGRYPEYQETESNVLGIVNASASLTVTQTRETIIGIELDLLEVFKKDIPLGIEALGAYMDQFGGEFGIAFLKSFRELVPMRMEECLNKMIEEKNRFSSVGQLNTAISFLDVPYKIEAEGGSVNGSWAFFHKDNPKEAILSGYYSFRMNRLDDEVVGKIFGWLIEKKLVK